VANDAFDPIALLQALDRERVTYIVIGGLGRVIQGSDELADGVDIVPSMREENLVRLRIALDGLKARRPDGGQLVLERDLAMQPVLTLSTGAGELKLVPQPAGTRGYDDLRRVASREALGRGLRPRVASLGDHSRMLAALDREADRGHLRTVNRLIELERELHPRGRLIER